MDLTKMIAEIEKRRDIIGKQRDKLRDIIDDVEELAGTCDDAWHDLECAIRAMETAVETLSEQA